MDWLIKVCIVVVDSAIIPKFVRIASVISYIKEVKVIVPARLSFNLVKYIKSEAVYGNCTKKTSYSAAVV